MSLGEFQEWSPCDLYYNLKYVVSVLSDAGMMAITNARSSAGSFSSIPNVCHVFH